jgi:hypothetical protein
MSRILPVAQSPHIWRRGGILSYPMRGCAITNAVWHRVIVYCLAPEDGQGSRSTKQPRISRPLYGIRPKESKDLNRGWRVLQNTDTLVPRPAGRRPGRANPTAACLSEIPRHAQRSSFFRWTLTGLRAANTCRRLRHPRAGVVRIGPELRAGHGNAKTLPITRSPLPWQEGQHRITRRA